jgi:hypothetical protein
MLRYHNKPPRRQKPRAKAVQGKPRWRVDGSYTTLIGLLIVLAALRVTVAFALPGGGPAVGDRVQFDAASIAPKLVVSAREVADPFARPGNSCTLDVNEMSHPGGALSVMAVRSDGVLLSWAGGATSAKADCRSGNQPILISADDYEALLKAEFPKH